MISVFFSYSHRDESFRDELETHLAMLKREGLIEAWHDRRIGAGTAVHEEISEQLEQAKVILLLVSPYFLASDYCHDREMKRALERHAMGEAIIIPVIVHPCDWQHSVLSNLRATPPDGKPISKFANLHDAYLAVVKDVRQAIVRLDKGPKKPQRIAPVTSISSTGQPSKRSSNLRLKREFTDHDKDMFLDGTFDFISNYFENSLDELQNRNPGIDVRFKQDGRQFTAALYRQGSKQSSCRIWLSDERHFTKGIAYSSVDSGSGFNELLNVEDDGHSLLLRPMMGLRGSNSNNQLTQEGAAEHLWSMFIEPLQ